MGRGTHAQQCLAHSEPTNADHAGGHGRADQRTATGDRQAQTRTPARTPGSCRRASDGSSRSSDRPWARSSSSAPSWPPSWSPTRTRTPTRRRRRRAHRPTPAVPPPPADGKLPLPAFAAPAGPRRQLPVPGRRGRQQAEQAAAYRQGPDRSRAGQRQHEHQPGQHRPAARQRQVAVHGQQLRQPCAAGLLQRHAVPPPDDVAQPGGAAVR